MTTPESLLNEIKQHLTTTFAKVDSWFDTDGAIRAYKPKNGGWAIDEILEHISLTSHFLLILIDKATAKALKNAQTADLKAEWENYTFTKNRLDEVGLHKSFDWIRPEHMEPKSEKTPSEVRLLLKQQVNRCFSCLDALSNGEGILYKTTMTVNNLGKIDVYEYIYFLSNHAQRHITQMEKVKAEYIATHLN